MGGGATMKCSVKGCRNKGIYFWNALLISVCLMHFEELWPFPAEVVSKMLEGKKPLITIEANATSQLGKLITMETGRSIDHQILKFDGRPFSAEYIVKEFIEVLKK